MKKVMKKAVLIFVGLFILGLLSVSYAKGDDNGKIVQALKQMYGGRVPIKGVEKVYSPMKGKGWQVIVYKFKVDVRGNTKSFPITAIKLGKKLYLTPAFFDVQKNKNLAMLWGFKIQDKMKLGLTKDHLIYGDLASCKHSMTIFSDPQCPFCRRFVPQFIDLGKKHNLCIYYLDFPLSFHKHAKTYSKYLITLLQHAPEKDRAKIIQDFYGTTDNPKAAEKFALKTAKKYGISKEQFYKYIAMNVDDILNKEMAIGKKAGVNGTPTVLIDFKKVNNSQINDILATLESKKIAKK